MKRFLLHLSQLLLVLTIIHTFARFPWPVIYAQDPLSTYCRDIVANNGQTVDTTLPSNPVNVVVNLNIDPAMPINKNTEVSLVYNIWGQIGEQRVPITPSGDNTIVGQLPANTFTQGIDRQGVTIRLYANNGGATLCQTTLAANLGTYQTAYPQACVNQNISDGYWTCSWSSLSQVWQLESGDCNAVPGTQTPAECFSADRNPFGFTTPPNYMCVQCAPASAQTKGYLESCTDRECIPGLTCRLSVVAGRRICLYPIGSRGENNSCTIGESECGTASGTGEETFCADSTDNSIIPKTTNPNTNPGLCMAQSRLGTQCNFDYECTPQTGPDSTCRGGTCYPAPTIAPSPNPTAIIIIATINPTQVPNLTPSPTGYIPPGYNRFGFIPCPAGQHYDPRRGDIVSDEGVQTAFGCIPISAGGFTTALFQIAIGIAGGIAFLLIIVGGLRILTSSGSPESMNEGKEIVTSAIVGLIIIVFSVFILRVVGVDILAIPGFRA